MKTLFHLITQYHRLQVVQEGKIRFLLSGNGLAREQTAINVEDLTEHIFDYSELAIRGLAFIPSPSRVLVIGLGGGVVPRELRRILPNAYIDIIEIDETVIKVAKEFFFFKEDERMKVHKGDAFVITREMKEQYDFIMFDAFLGNYTPFPLMSIEFTETLFELASDDSILTVNCCCAHPSFPNQVNTYRSAFGDNIYRLDGRRNKSSTTLYVLKGDITLPSRIEVTEEIESAKIFTLSNT